MKQLTTEQAIAFAKSHVYNDWSYEQLVRFQLFQRNICMDFSIFHKAMENVLKRPIYTHEFAYWDNLKKEYLGVKNAPTIEEIIKLIPKEKLLIIGI